MPKKDIIPKVENQEYIDENFIKEAVDIINEIANKTLYKGSVEIGEYILKNFFNNDIKLASSKNPKKGSSFSRLCEREDLTVHPNQLALMVRVASQERFFIEEKVDKNVIEKLSFTHKASLAKLDNNKKKISLVNKCFKGVWATRRLEEEIKKEFSKIPSNTKISPIRITKKYIGRIGDVLNEVDEKALNFESEDLSKLSDKKREFLSKHLNELKSKVEENRQRSDIIYSNCDSLLSKLSLIDEEKKSNPPKRGRKPKSS